MENLPDPARFGWQNIIYQLHIYNWSTPEIDKKIADIRARNAWNVPVMVGEFQAGGIWDYTLTAFNNNDLSWFTWTYKGAKTQKSDWFLFAADIPVASLQEDSYEDIAAKWGAPCRTENGFVENTELAATLKPYFAGNSLDDTTDPGIPQTGGVSAGVPAAAAVAALAGGAAAKKRKKR
jgi:LPXTG-motif cell wall-anchored protein